MPLEKFFNATPAGVRVDGQGNSYACDLQTTRTKGYIERPACGLF